MVDDNKAPDAEDKKPAEDKAEESTKSPAEDPGGQDEKKDQAPLKDTSEKLEGKTLEDVKSMFTNLEKKLGERDESTKQVQTLKDNLEKIGKAITSDPEAVKRVEAQLKRMDAGLPETQKGDEEAQTSHTDLKVAENRKALENEIISKFSQDLGLNKLSKEDRDKEMKKVASALGNLVDPTGIKPMAQVLGSVPLPQLRQRLEDSYYIANRPDVLAGDQAPDASIGRLSSASSSKSDRPEGLTDSEKQMAKNLGLTEKAYLEGKNKEA